MSYIVRFTGNFLINEKLDDKLAEYLERFYNTRHVKRNIEKTKQMYPNWKEFCFRNRIGEDGEYFANGENFLEKDDDIISYRVPPGIQPSILCPWRIDEFHKSIIWDGKENLIPIEEHAQWLQYLIENFLSPCGYIVNGSVTYKTRIFYSEREEAVRVGKITITDNVIDVKDFNFV